MHCLYCKDQVISLDKLAAPGKDASAPLPHLTPSVCIRCGGLMILIDGAHFRMPTRAEVAVLATSPAGPVIQQLITEGKQNWQRVLMAQNRDNN